MSSYWYYTATILAIIGCAANSLCLITETDENVKEMCPNSFLWNTLIFATVTHLYKLVSINAKSQRTVVAEILDIVMCATIATIIGLQLSKNCSSNILKTLIYPTLIFNIISLSIYGLFSMRLCLESQCGLKTREPVTYFPPVLPMNETTPINRRPIYETYPRETLSKAMPNSLTELRYPQIVQSSSVKPKAHKSSRLSHEYVQVENGDENA